MVDGIFAVGYFTFMGTGRSRELFHYYRIVKNKDNKRKLENVNVSVPGTNIGTVTNADGVFSLKIKTRRLFWDWRFHISGI